jgi:Mg/Co/Ni transporter MgtE
MAMGMPTEGKDTGATIQQFIRTDVPTCGLNETLDDVKRKVSGDWNICVVIDKRQIVLGMLEVDDLPDGAATIEESMKPAPLTFRPSLGIDEAAEFFEEKKQVPFALVTKSSGQLIGAIRKAEVME